MSSPVDDVVRDLGRILDALPVDWYLFGAQAAFIRGARRMTADVDVTVLPRHRGAHELVHELTRDFVLRVPDQDGFPHDLEDAAALVRAGAELAEVEPMVDAVAEGLGEDDIRRALAELRRRVRP